MLEAKTQDLMVDMHALIPLIVTNALFIKLHPVVTLSHVTGWLVKLIVAGMVSAWLLA